MLLLQSMFRDDLLWSYKSALDKISAKGKSGNKPINCCDKSVNSSEAPLGGNQSSENNLVIDFINVDPILKEIMSQ